jgi:hypothetical protein
MCERERERDSERGRERGILGFCCSVIEIFTFLGCFAISFGSWLPMFWDCCTVVDGTDKISQKSETGCNSVLHNNPSRV